MLQDHLDARVLVVDDEPVNVIVLIKLLERVGIMNTEGVTRSSDVLERTRLFEPDIILLDLHMPQPDGFELLRLLGEVDPDDYLPIVVISADITEQAKERALAAGAADFLTKPFPATETLLRIGNLVQTRRLHQKLRRHGVQLAAEIDALTKVDDATRDRIRLVTAVVEQGDSALTIVYQPIVEVATGAVRGAEALARFSVVPIRPPNEWFEDAHEAGVGTRLELTAVRTALEQARGLPDGIFVSVNVSPTTLRVQAFADVLAASVDRPVVIELTEHERIVDYGPINDTIDAFRERGARLAVDDTGAGFASLHHILKLKPDFIKLDRMLVTDIDSDPARRSLTRALVTFAEETGAALIAEGIETVAELATLRELGVHCGQGYYLGRPQPLPMLVPS